MSQLKIEIKTVDMEDSMQTFAKSVIYSTEWHNLFYLDNNLNI